ncbi:MAG: hypothetical protein ACR2PA_26995, partial [Hyphomicrobiaceae bacterium]
MRHTRSPKSKRAAIAAARTYLKAKLGWLRGFPTHRDRNGEIVWQVLPRVGSRSQSEVLHVTRERLRRTEFGRNTVRRRFPRALRDVVGDVEAWTARADELFAILKAVVHDGGELPDWQALLAAYAPRRSIRTQIGAIVDSDRTLAPLITSLLWIHWFDARSFAAALDNLEAHRQPISGLLERLEHDHGQLPALQCLQLVDDRRGSKLLALLADQRCWTVPLSHGDFHSQLVNGLKRRRTGGGIGSTLEREGAKRPEPRLGPDLCRFISSLCTRDEKIRGRILILMDLILSRELLQDWQEWWQQAATLERETRRLMGSFPPRLTWDHAEKCRAMEAQIREAQNAPRAFRWSDVGDLFDSISRSAEDAEFESLVSCARSLTGSHRGRPIAQLL